MRKTCLDTLYKLAIEDERIFFIGSDLGVGTLSEFKNEIPERFFMEGISEANIIGVASGLAMEGKIVYVNTIASFLTRRAYEQILLDMCLHKVNVRLIGNGGGMVYAPLGPTHMTVEDFATMRSIPNMTVVAPADADEMKRLMPQTIDYSGPMYIRLAKGYDPIVSDERNKFEIGKAICMKEGNDALIISTGITLKLAIDAAEELMTQNINASVLHIHTVKPLDVGSILKYAEKSNAIVTLEEHSILGGLGSAVAEIIAEANFTIPKKFKRIGIPDVFPDDYGSQKDLMEKYMISQENTVSTIKSLLLG